MYFEKLNKVTKMSSTLGTLDNGEWGLASPELKIVIIVCER
jgi:hypothetical protein